MKTRWDALIKKYETAFKQEQKALIWTQKEIEKALEAKATLIEQDASSSQLLDDQEYLYSVDLAFDSEFRSRVSALQQQLDAAIANLKVDEERLMARVNSCRRLVKKYEFLRDREALAVIKQRELNEADQLEDWINSARSG